MKEIWLPIPLVDPRDSWDLSVVHAITGEQTIVLEQTGQEKPFLSL